MQLCLSKLQKNGRLRKLMPEASLNSSLRNVLREATKDAHSTLDARVGAIKATSTLEGYVTYLRHMGAFHHWCRPAVALLASKLDLSDNSQRLGEAIRSDLSHLGRPSERHLLSGRELSSMSDDELCGVAYVVEGASLGSRYTLRSVIEHLPQPTPTEYLSAMATAASDRWPLIANRLESVAVNKELAIRGALAAFHQADQLFSQQLPSREAIQ